MEVIAYRSKGTNAQRLNGERKPWDELLVVKKTEESSLRFLAALGMTWQLDGPMGKKWRFAPQIIFF